MVKAVLFDLDGVIFDNNDTQIRNHQVIARKMGLRVPSGQEIFNQMGKKWDDFIKNLWPDVDVDVFKKLYKDAFIKERLKTSKMDGVEEVLNSLKNSGIPLGIVTGAHKESVDERLKITKLGKYFDVIVTGDDTENHKPHPEPIHRACKELNVKPEEVIFIGDSVNDMGAAKNANASFIGFRWEGANVFDNVDVHTVDSMKELPDTISVVGKKISD